MTAPLEGIKVVDWTQVQSGPSCSQMLAWFGADVIKIERPGVGDATRSQVNNMPGADSLYFLQLNANKKSLELDVRTDEGKKILTDLLKDADIFLENLHPGAVDKLGFGWEDVHKLNPRLIMGTIKGFNPVSRFSSIKAYEPVAQCAGGAAATTGWFDGENNVPTQSGAALGDSNSGMHLCIGILAALLKREKTGVGDFVYQSMHNATANLCRIKLRDQLNLDTLGELPYYACYPNYKWGKDLPRAANAEGGGVLGWCYKCKNYKEDPNDYVYIVVQRSERGWKQVCEAIERPDLVDDPRFATAEARDENKQALWAEIEKYTMQFDKYTATDKIGACGVPIGPVRTWREIENDEELIADGTIVEIEQGGKRGTFKTLGMPMFFSDWKPEYKRAPGLGENNVEVLEGLGYTDDQIKDLAAKGVIKNVDSLK